MLLLLCLHTWFGELLFAATAAVAGQEEDAAELRSAEAVVGSVLSLVVLAAAVAIALAELEQVVVDDVPEVMASFFICLITAVAL